MYIFRSSQVYLAHFLVDRSDVFEVDAELATWMGCPLAVLECDLDTWVVDGLAVLESLEEQSEAGGYAERDEWPEFHGGAVAFSFLEIWHVCGAVVFALPVFEQFEVRPSGGEITCFLVVEGNHAVGIEVLGVGESHEFEVQLRPILVLAETIDVA